MVDGIGSMNSLAAANHGKQGKSAAWGWPLEVTEIILPVPNHLAWIGFCFYVLLFWFWVFFYFILFFFKFLFLLQATIMYFFLC